MITDLASIISAALGSEERARQAEKRALEAEARARVAEQYSFNLSRELEALAGQLEEAKSIAHEAFHTAEEIDRKKLT